MQTAALYGIMSEKIEEEDIMNKFKLFQSRIHNYFWITQLSEFKLTGLAKGLEK